MAAGTLMYLLDKYLFDTNKFLSYNDLLHKKFKIPEQSKDDLIIIMRYVFIEYAYPQHPTHLKAVRVLF